MNTRFLTLSLSALLLSIGCGGRNEPTGSGRGGLTSELGQLLHNAGAFQDFQETYEETLPEEFESTSGNDLYFCTRKTVNLVEGYSDYPQFDPNSQVIFPGNLLQGNTLDDATPSSIPVERGPGTIVITLVNGAATASRRLEAVNLSSVFDAMNQIIADNPGDLPARTTYSLERITSREQLGVSLRASYNTLSAEVQGSLDYNSDIRYNRFLVRLTQSYYTIVFQQPTDLAHFFGPNVTAEQLSRYVQPGNPAAYVSSVTYGRVFYLLIQSTESVQAMKGSIDASFKGAVAGGSISADATYVGELKSVRIGGYAIGGEANRAAAALTGDFEALKRFIAEGGTITTGQPLSYTVNAANDPARQLKVKVATQYDVVDCAPLSDALSDGVAWYRGNVGVSTVDHFGARGITRWQDLFGKQRNDNSRDAVVPFGGPSVAGLHNPGNPDGGRVPSFEYQPHYRTGRMNFPGTALRETDYTLFVIVNRLGLQPHETTPVYWTWGESSAEGRGLRIGFDDHRTVSISHGGLAKLTAPLQRPIPEFHLFTFVFSQQDGMRIYVNGLEEAHDPTLTIPIVQFLGASLGVSSANHLATIEMLEYQIYDFATTDAQRRAVETGLLERYRL